MTQWILGIRPEYEGLRIDPCIPSSWDGFEAVRWYRGCRYFIHAERVGTGNGVELEQDGEPVPGLVLSLPEDNRRGVRVTVRIGSR
jgi:cellobiose phosphorylase